MCRDLPVRQTARALRVGDKKLWRRIEHYVTEARKKQDMSQVRIVGIDETSLRRGQDYVTVVHDLDAKRLLFCTPGRDHQTIQAFARDLHAHGGEPTENNASIWTPTASTSESALWACGQAQRQAAHMPTGLDYERRF